MVMCLRERGCVDLAGMRGCRRASRMTGRLSQPDDSGRKLALMHFPTASASSHTGGASGLRGMLEFAGITSAFALVGARAGGVCPASRSPSIGAIMWRGESPAARLR